MTDRRAISLRWAVFIIATVLVRRHLAHAESVFSPGPLSRVHQAFDGLENCSNCHSSGKAIASSLCESCHLPVKNSIAHQTGYHGRLRASEQDTCQKCHTEHVDGEQSIMWQGKKEDFKHELTGWPLLGAHVQTTCRSCHQQRFVKEGPIADIFKRKIAEISYMGVSRRCKDCHFDEHRGQESQNCETCHDATAWKPTVGFNHQKTSYRLTGKHREAQCMGCHWPLEDTAPPTDMFIGPLSRSFTKYADIPHAACTDCHQDVHKGELGKVCTSCHTTAGWRIIAPDVADIAFHQKTHYPLRGAHVTVKCQRCHGPFGAIPAVYGGLPFAACTNCHVDAHQEQLTNAKGETLACEGCHTVESFEPSQFPPQRHNKTRFALTGAHQAVACVLCHERNAALLNKVPPATLTKLRQQGRKKLFGTMQFENDRDLNRCSSCHADVHRGQFSKRVSDSGCKDCHRSTSFHDIKFNHDTESRFTLTGAHEKVPCLQCHISESLNGHHVAVFNPLDTACSSCHFDVHYGQFAPSDDSHAECQSCHTTQTFKDVQFDHNDPNRAAFPLNGKHMFASCHSCHRDITTVEHRALRQYKGLSKNCDDCHEDYHQGLFSTLPTYSDGRWQVSKATADKDPCRMCHDEAGWLPSNYADHQHSDFPLQGAHTATPCQSCHVRSFSEPLNVRCNGCHQDIHAGEFGGFCETCHTQADWQVDFSVDAHRSTNFPLLGAHGAITCEQCHPGAFQRNYRGTAVTCIGCHLDDFYNAAAVTVDHVASKFSEDCRACHETWNWARARPPAHDACFQIHGGPHGSVTCEQCHTSVRGAVAQGLCMTFTASCTSCHTHNCATTDAIHQTEGGVPGYQCSDRKCYECHRFNGQ